jgi:5-formyltetrahydrofolate cyclo-ligase
MSTKPLLRKSAREKIQQLPAAELAEKSARLCRRIEALAEWADARVLCIFAPLPGEPDVELLSFGGRKVCYPRINGTGLDLYYVENPRAMEVSRWEIREPFADHATASAIPDIDLILVPGLAFSPDGARLGRGAGFYDRLLARRGWRARKIGICFECQVFETLPREAHDHQVDWVITEERSLWAAGK